MELALDFVPATLHWRMVVRRRTMSDEEISKLVDAVVAGLRAL